MLRATTPPLCEWPSYLLNYWMIVVEDGCLLYDRRLLCNSCDSRIHSKNRQEAYNGGVVVEIALWNCDFLAVLFRRTNHKYSGYNRRETRQIYHIYYLREEIILSERSFLAGRHKVSAEIFQLLHAFTVISAHSVSSMLVFLGICLGHQSKQIKYKCHF